MIDAIVGVQPFGNRDLSNTDRTLAVRTICRASSASGPITIKTAAGGGDANLVALSL